MIDYNWLNKYEEKSFHTISEVCEILGLDMDKLRYQCLLHGIFPAQYKGELGLDTRSLKIIGMTLFSERHSTGIYEDPWA